MIRFYLKIPEEFACQDNDTLKFNLYSIGRQLFRGVELSSRTRNRRLSSRKV